MYYNLIQQGHKIVVNVTETLKLSKWFSLPVFYSFL